MNLALVQVFANLFAIIITWTNPSLNADGTPCHDLAGISFRCTFGADTLKAWVPELEREGLRDTVRFQFPPSSVPRTWRLWAVAVDTTGNESDTSNVLVVPK